MKTLFFSIFFLILLTISPISNGQTYINVWWDESPSEYVAGYSVYYKTPTNDIISTNIIGRTNTSAIIRTDVNVVYELYVTAKDAEGLESDPSNKIRTEIVYVNGIGRPTPITFLDFGNTNFPGFTLLTAPTVGILSGTPPNVVYTLTNSGVTDWITYTSPEQSSIGHIINYYMFRKAITNAPPTIRIVL